MTEQESILTSLGYKEAERGKWLKPVGLHLFSFEIELNLWTNWFMSMQDEILIYDSKEYSDFEDFYSWVIRQEAWTRINIGKGGDFRV
jgi:hypothetical protein